MTTSADLEALANWYLRLNGFFTIPNFVIHAADMGGLQRTEADILAVRFPHRREQAGLEVLRDEERLASERQLFVIAEVKPGRCRLNGPWSRKADANVNRVLEAVGILVASEIPAAAAELYESMSYTSEVWRLQLICFGSEVSSTVPATLCQITWREVFSFVFARYQDFWKAKRQHQQWPSVGKELFEIARDKSIAEFLQDAADRFKVSVA